MLQKYYAQLFGNWVRRRLLQIVVRPGHVSGEARGQRGERDVINQTRTTDDPPTTVGLQALVAPAVLLPHRSRVRV